MKHWLTLVFAVSGLTLAGCNTMEGVGTDIARGGQKIEDAARATTGARRARATSASTRQRAPVARA